ncbi:MAG: T9SS type A sorting domain-containing protein, partial [Fidelibacterota bacterium]
AYETAPGGDLPAGTVLAAGRFWIITHTGRGDFSVELTFNLGPSTFTAREQEYPVRLRLLQRDTGGTLPWEIESYGSSATDSSVTFAGITGFSQFAVGRTTDTEGPSISSEFRRVANPDDMIEVDATVSDPSGISSMRLHYLEGSSPGFDQADMNQLNATTYRAGIPVASTVLRGLAYYIVGTDGVGNVTITDTSSVPVAFPAGTFNTSMSGTAFSNGFPFNRWRLISIPGDIADTTVTSIIQGELGEAPSDETWRIFRYTGPGRDDYVPVGSFTSGESYFLKQIVREVRETPLHFSLGAGQSVDMTGTSWSLPARRWRFIASPYPFPVSVAADQGTFNGPYTYGAFGTGGQEGWSVGQVQTTFRPWGGYIIYNNTDYSQALEIRPPGMAKSILAKADQSQPEGWLVHMTVEGERYYDGGNTVGRLEGAAEGRDPFDAPEPPLLEDCIALTMERSDWATGAGWFTSDIRSVEETNGVWDLDLYTRGEAGAISLTYRFEGEVPGGVQIVLLDLVTRVACDLTAGEAPLPITDYTDKVPYHLKVMAGTEDYVQRSIAEALAELPEEFALSPNYPNPFNPATTLSYALPQPVKVSLRVYNLLGQEVATLVNGWADLGYHEAVWQGLDRTGRAVASGVYIAVLRAEGLVKTRKMVLLR